MDYFWTDLSFILFCIFWSLLVIYVVIRFLKRVRESDFDPWKSEEEEEES